MGFPLTIRGSLTFPNEASGAAMATALAVLWKVSDDVVVEGERLTGSTTWLGWLGSSLGGKIFDSAEFAVTDSLPMARIDYAIGLRKALILACTIAAAIVIAGLTPPRTGVAWAWVPLPFAAFAAAWLVERVRIDSWLTDQLLASRETD